MTDQKHDHTETCAVHALRGFDVREASTITISSVGVSSVPVVLCHLDTVEAVDATDEDAPSTTHDIVVTPEVAEQLADDLHNVAQPRLPDKIA